MRVSGSLRVSIMNKRRRKSHVMFGGRDGESTVRTWLRVSTSWLKLKNTYILENVKRLRYVAGVRCRKRADWNGKRDGGRKRW